MENIDKKIDQLMRAKLTSLMQEHTVRIKKINIKYMSKNQKHTLGRLDACYDSHDRLLRGASRELVRIEKAVREKFSEPISEERKTETLIFVNTEVDLLSNNLEEALRNEYKKHGKEDLFLEKFNASQKKIKGNIEEQTQKMMKSMAENSGQTRGHRPAELSAIFEMDKTFLVNMNFINPLQKISSAFEELNGDPEAQKIYQKVKESIRDMAKSSLENPEGTADNMKERKARKRLAAKKTLLFGDILNNIQMLADQLALSPEKRNAGIIDKVWARLEKSLLENDEDERVLADLKLFYEYFQCQRN